MKRLLFFYSFLLVLMAGPVRVSLAQGAAPAVQTQNTSSPVAQVPEKNKEDEDETAAYRKSPSVRAIGAKLGMNADQSALAFEVTNFLILAMALGWFLVRALPKIFRDRSGVIQKHLVDARTATEEANARLGSVEARLGKVDGIIAEMRVQAERDAVLDEQRIQASLVEEKNKILAAADQEIAAATVQARRQLQQYAAELAIDHASRNLVITPETDRLLVQSFARRLDEGGVTGKDGERN